VRDAILAEGAAMFWRWPGAYVALWGRDRPAGLEAHVRASAIAAHIHLGKTGKAGNVVVPLCANAKCKSGVHGSATLTAAVLKALTTDGTYVNVHTAKNPNGEIRGQVARRVRRWRRASARLLRRRRARWVKDGPMTSGSR
jgi:hypothetical protein